MKVAVVHGPRDLRIDEEPDLPASPGENEVLVQTVVSGMSAGTELSVYTARYGVPFLGWSHPYPCAAGYLNVGQIQAVGSAVERYRPGDVILAFKGHRSAYAVAPAEIYGLVSPELPPTVAVFTYLINLGLHALRRGQLQTGERVAVVGLGPIGLGAVAISRKLGSPVVGIDPVAERRALALALGADLVLDPTARDFGEDVGVFAGDDGIDLAVETAGTWPAVRTACEVVRREGRVSIIALHPGEAEFNPLGEFFYKKQLSLISTSVVSREDYPVERVRFTLRRNCAFILDGLVDGTIRYAPAVTDVVGYRELTSVYERMANGDRTMGAVAVHWE